MLNFHINEDIINQYQEKMKSLDSHKSRYDYTQSPYASSVDNCFIRHVKVYRRPIIINNYERASLEAYFDTHILPDYDFLPNEIADAKENFVYTFVTMNPNTTFDDWINNKVVQPNQWILNHAPMVKELQSRIMAIGSDPGISMRRITRPEPTDSFIYNPMFRKTLPSLYHAHSVFHNDSRSSLNVCHVSMETGDYEKIILDSLSKFTKTLNPVSAEWAIEPVNYLTLVNNINKTNEVIINE